MDDGDINVSAYDTAWVALVEDINKTGIPLFPSTLQWIADNQLPDGSWGDKNVFLAYERILCTLACVVALRTWNIHPQNMERGKEIKFCLMENAKYPKSVLHFYSKSSWQCMIGGTQNY